MKFGFIYLWKDTKRNKFYLGSHQGNLDDGYGKKHSQESLEKISKAKSGKPSKRKWCHHDDTIKNLISRNNPKRKSIRTPYGDFYSVGEFTKKIGLITPEGLANAIKLNTTLISKIRAERSPLFTADGVGKTPSELGYYYIADEEVNCGTN